MYRYLDVKANFAPPSKHAMHMAPDLQQHHDKLASSIPPGFNLCSSSLTHTHMTPASLLCISRKEDYWYTTLSCA